MADVQFMGIEQLAAELGVPVRTIYSWRSAKGYGPKSYRIGKHVKFKRHDVEEWIEEQADPRPVR